MRFYILMTSYAPITYWSIIESKYYCFLTWVEYNIWATSFACDHKSVSCYYIKLRLKKLVIGKLVKNFTHLKWMKIAYICLFGDQTFASLNTYQDKSLITYLMA